MMKKKTYLVLLSCSLFSTGNIVLWAADKDFAETEAAKSLLDLNTRFHNEYKQGKEQILEKIGPLILSANGKIIFLHNGKREEFPAVPSDYNTLKEVDHVPLVIFLTLRNCSGKIDEQTEKKLAELKESIAKVQADVTELNLTTESLQRQNQILSICSTLIDQCLAGKTIQTFDLQSFGSKLKPLLIANIDDAAALQISTLDKRVKEFRKELSPDEWNHLHVIIHGRHMRRIDDTNSQYFAKLLNESGEGGKIIYFEDPRYEEDKALDLLATHILDGAIGEEFFGDAKSMHRDVLGGGAKQYLDTHEIK